MNSAAPISQEWFARSALEVAPALLGCIVARRLPDGTVMRGVIVETEAYLQDDPASHSFRGPTPRNAVMFGPAGYSYVYFIYGMHFCLNVVTGNTGVGEAVLLRALDFGPECPRRVGAGPAKLCRALGIDKAWNGRPLFSEESGLWLEWGSALAGSVVTSPRVGISQAQERPWRWMLVGNDAISRP